MSGPSSSAEHSLGLARERPLVLIADDDEMQRFLFREALEAVGFDLIEATDGEAALAAFDQHTPDLVILDVIMAPMDGFRACSALRQLPGGDHVPVLMVTGLDDLQSIERAYDVGGTDFLAKPINWTLLGHRVRYMHRANQALTQLQRSRASLAEAQAIARLGSWAWQPDTGRFQGSEQTCRIFGFDPAQPPTELAELIRRIHPDDRDRAAWIVDEAVRARRAFDLDVRVDLPGGARPTVHIHAQLDTAEGGGPSVWKGTFQDVTERRQAEARIQHLAHHDALTGLPNRVLFRDRLEQALARAERDDGMVAVLGVDLDGFKEINDTLGHAAGDHLLRLVGERLQVEVRGSDTVARLGGDEFAIIQVGLDQPNGVGALSTRVLQAIARPFELDAGEVLIGASLGIAIYPEHSCDPDQLLINADMAMYRAKADGRGNARFFEAGMDVALRTRKEIEQELRQGLAEGWFELHYQPQVAVDASDVVGAEALLRLRHPDKGLVPPGEFIKIAEDTGLIVPIGEWALRTACAEAATWQRPGQPPIRVGVNLSVAQFRQAGLVDVVADALAESGLPPALLELEITESILMRDTASALELLDRLRALGVRIAMDDFGTGYSSLSYLHLFPFDRIKIDRSFVQDLSRNIEAAAIVRAIVGLGRSLNMMTTAEGVEKQVQLAYLEDEACDEVQGFYFGRPVPAAEFAARIRRGRYITGQDVPDHQAPAPAPAVDVGPMTVGPMTPARPRPCGRRRQSIVNHGRLA